MNFAAFSKYSFKCQLKMIQKILLLLQIKNMYILPTHDSGISSKRFSEWILYHCLNNLSNISFCVFSVFLSVGARVTRGGVEHLAKSFNATKLWKRCLRNLAFPGYFFLNPHLCCRPSCGTSHSGTLYPVRFTCSAESHKRVARLCVPPINKSRQSIYVFMTYCTHLFF